MRHDARAPSVLTRESPPVTVIFPKQQEGLDRVLPWPLWIARKRGGPLTLVVPFARADNQRINIGLAGGAKHVTGSTGIVTAVREALDSSWGVDTWRPSETEAAEDDERTPVTLVLAPFDTAVETVLDVIAESSATQAIMCGLRKQGEESLQAQQRRQLLRGATCEIVLLRVASRMPTGHGVLVPITNGPHSDAALNLAADLVEGDHGPATALYVEPDVGTIAKRVGERILDSIMAKTLASRSDDLSRRVVIHDHPHVGILEVVKELEPELILLGSSKANALGQRLRSTVGLRVVKGTENVAVGVVRAGIPLRTRTLRRLSELVQQAVPQMEREARIDLVERVQSNSQWDFDFVSLTCLSTVIAGIGLIQNSPAVVIGAMLVAPLMTPMLGMGLALAHGNPYLVRTSGRSIVLGFVTAVGLAFLLGKCHPGLYEASSEMLVRNWPTMLDLFVAFVSGIAAAYASSRPNLLAALPGVAIAAALVPPIATAGLAASIGNYSLAMGAALLFTVNMVAIVLAAAVTLWAVGLRGERGSTSTRVAGWSLVGATLLMGIQLSFAPPTYEAPMPISDAAVEVIDDLIGDRWRLLEVHLDENVVPAELLVRLGGSEPPPQDMAQRMLDRLAPFIRKRVTLRLRHHWAMSAEVAR